MEIKSLTGSWTTNFYSSSMILNIPSISNDENDGFRRQTNVSFVLHRDSISTEHY